MDINPSILFQHLRHLLAEAEQRESHHLTITSKYLQFIPYIVITTTNSRNQATSNSLNSVTSSLIHRLLGIHIRYSLWFAKEIYPEWDQQGARPSRPPCIQWRCKSWVPSRRWDGLDMNNQLRCSQISVTPLYTQWVWPLRLVSMAMAFSTERGFPKIFPSYSTIVSQPRNEERIQNGPITRSGRTPLCSLVSLS